MTRPSAAAPPSQASRAARVTAGAAWVAALVAVVAVLSALGSGPMAPPPLLDREALRLWFDDRDTATAAFAVLRLVGLGLAWYLLTVTVLGLVARLTRVPGLVRAIDLATLPAARALLGAVAGIGVTASAAGLAAAGPAGDPVGASGPAGSPAAAAVIQRLPDTSEVVLRRLPDEEGSATMRVEEDPTPQGPTEWTVVAGDHLWHVAESTLDETWGRPVTDAEVAPYWSLLVEHNRDRLLDPSNPDLIVAGQVIDLPPPGPGG